MGQRFASKTFHHLWTYTHFLRAYGLLNVIRWAMDVQDRRQEISPRDLKLSKGTTCPATCRLGSLWATDLTQRAWTEHQFPKRIKYLYCILPSVPSHEFISSVYLCTHISRSFMESTKKHTGNSGELGDRDFWSTSPHREYNLRRSSPAVPTGAVIGVMRAGHRAGPWVCIKVHQHFCPLASRLIFFQRVSRSQEARDITPAI